MRNKKVAYMDGFELNVDAESHPIDIAEALAEHREWDFDRIAEDRISISVEGQWRHYSVTMAWSTLDETLRILCTFDLAPPRDKQPALYDLLNRINDQCWAGAFCYWDDSKQMVFRYALMLADDQCASLAQIARMINICTLNAERYYPAMQLLIWGNRSPSEAIQIAISEAYGHA